MQRRPGALAHSSASDTPPALFQESTTTSLPNQGGGHEQVCVLPTLKYRFGLALADLFGRGLLAIYALATHTPAGRGLNAT